MSVCRSGHGVGVVNGCLYALGGHDGVSYRNKVEFFDPQVGEWTSVGQMGMCKAVAGVAVMKEHWHLEHISFAGVRAIFVWPWNENAGTEQKQQTNGNRAIWLIYRTDTNARGFWLVKRTLWWKNFSELSINQPILHFDVILQHDWLIEQYLLHIRVFFGEETKRPCFDLFIHWLIKQITNTYRNHFSRTYENRFMPKKKKKWRKKRSIYFCPFVISRIHWVSILIETGFSTNLNTNHVAGENHAWWVRIPEKFQDRILKNAHYPGGLFFHSFNTGNN